MHSKDRTLIASLGFADKDKTNSRHDLACRFVIVPEQATRIANLFWPYRGPRYLDGVPNELSHREWASHVVRVSPDAPSTVLTSGKTEVVLGKGEGKYRTTVGFIDAFLSAVRVSPCSVEPTDEYVAQWQKWREQAQYESAYLTATDRKGMRYPDTNFEGCPAALALLSSPEPACCETPVYEQRVEVAVEVKISPEPIGTTLRQIKFYRDAGQDLHSIQPNWVLVTDYDVSAADIALLKSDGITHIRLGPAFDEFVRAEQAAPAGVQLVF